LVIWMVLFDLSSFSESASELDLQDVRFSLTDMFGYINSIRNEHIACPQNYVAIDSYICDRIETVKSQHNFGVWSTFPLGDTGKLDSVDPSLVVYPPALKLVEIEKWIRDSE